MCNVCGRYTDTPHVHVMVTVQECVPESLELKKKVFTSLDELADDHVIMASSTSCLPATSFTSELKHRTQCIVAHPVGSTSTTIH